MDDLLNAFWSYEAALAADDLTALDHWFGDSPDTLRAEGDIVLTGPAAIADFRRTRTGGAPPRTVERVHEVRLAPDLAVLTAETLRADGSRGLQTQVWQRSPEGWRIRAAHVSAVPGRTVQAPGSGAGAVWRRTGEPLVAGAPDGPLSGVRIAVKDLFAVARHRTGAGNPAWLAEAAVEETHAQAVRLLLDAGADIAGIAHTDELAFSLSGANVHYGTAPNPAAPGRIPGGSSGGPASAVAHGWADLGLATDTAGSIRVPASYCGLYGWRPTHGTVPTGGLLALAPSFDTAGLLARDPGLLRTAAGVLLKRTDARPVRHLVVDDRLTALAEPEVQASFTAACRALALRAGLPAADRIAVATDDLDDWLDAFRTVQAAQAWRQHGAWIDKHPGALAPEVEARFAAGRDVPAEGLGAAEKTLAEARAHLGVALPPDTALLLPATGGSAPPTDAGPREVEAVRAATLRLTCLASIAGLPSVALPRLRVRGLPVGLCLVGARDTDLALLSLATH
ncbi:amidase [Streptomyces sp. NPDC101776]|uniref:amidase n=1 Tax=Streptomyces sp. NPDC101776 TaxID=3366146 RepID=UPI003829F257